MPPDAATVHAVKTFMQRLEGKYPVIESILYGSRARGDHMPESDADLALVLKGEKSDRYKLVRDLGGVEFDVMLDTGILIHALPLWEDEFEQPELFSNPALVRNILRDGIRIL